MDGSCFMVRIVALEDNFNDIISKAQRGLKVPDEALARHAHVGLEELHRVKEGQFDEEAVRRVAPVLRLRLEPLLEIGRGTYQPREAGKIPGLAMFVTEADGMLVNSYLAWDPETLNGVCFDTGSDASAMIQFAAEREIRIQMVLLTHTHADHIGDLKRLCLITEAKAFVAKREAMENVLTFEPGHQFQVPKLVIGSQPTPGHSRGSVSYVISGLSRPVVVVGDALFAGSLGTGFFSYAEGIKNVCEKIMTLPDETIICPGHGPMTTVGEEKAHNPFLPEARRNG